MVKNESDLGLCVSLGIKLTTLALVSLLSSCNSAKSEPYRFVHQLNTRCMTLVIDNYEVYERESLGTYINTLSFRNGDIDFQVYSRVTDSPSKRAVGLLFLSDQYLVIDNYKSFIYTLDCGKSWKLYPVSKLRDTNFDPYKIKFQTHDDYIYFMYAKRIYIMN